MDFKLGCRVLCKFQYIEATVIGIDTSEHSRLVLLGWTSSEPCINGAWDLSNVSYNNDPTTKIVDNIGKYTTAYWMHTCSLSVISHHSGTFSRVNQNTLRKRIRDQIAQEIFKG